ncbi:MAG TPA: AAA domain-containing protein, partial [Nocardia sp.]|uniref:AAA domain-containing protein n=1 Tax=Nocardia sp. TaxID=1821 RepID=UPI002B4B8C8E
MSKTRRPYPVTELLEAVRLEIVAEQRSDGGDAPKVSLSNGRLVASVAGRHEYLFTCAKWDESLDGSPVLVRASTSRGRWTQAEASRLPDGKVRLITEIDLGQSIRNMRLRRDDSARLAIVAERLESAADGDDAIRLQSSGWIVGRGEPRIGYEDNPGRWVANWATLRLNARQRIAVRQSLASEVLFLWGPPGTGKTDVVGHIVEGNVRQGHNVLFLAPTRVAVDQALERICDLLVDETGFSQGMVQRA